MRTVPVVAIVMLAACNNPNQYTFSGVPVDDLFPFDGLRKWEFTSSDTEIPYRLVGEMSPDEPDEIDGRRVYTVDYWTDCESNNAECTDGEVLRTLLWSSNGTDGVYIYGYDTGTGLVSLDPPLQVGTDVMKRGDTVDTTTDGASWTSEMMGLEPCPVNMNVNWEECGRFVITSDAADGYPLAGTYWANAGFNVVAFELEGEETGQWGLSDHECIEECDGSW